MLELPFLVDSEPYIAHPFIFIACSYVPRHSKCSSHKASPSIFETCTWWRAAEQKDLDEAAAAGFKLHFAAISAGDVLVTPPGWMVSVKAQSSTWGVRRSFLRTTEAVVQNLETLTALHEAVPELSADAANYRRFANACK